MYVITADIICLPVQYTVNVQSRKHVTREREKVQDDVIERYIYIYIIR